MRAHVYIPVHVESERTPKFCSREEITNYLMLESQICKFFAVSWISPEFLHLAL